MKPLALFPFPFDRCRRDAGQRSFSILSAILGLLLFSGSLEAQTETTLPPAAPAMQGGTADAPVEAGKTARAIPVSHLPPAEMKKILAALVTPGAAVLDQPDGKSLMLVDTSANIERAASIAALIDTPALAGARLELFQPRAASADELASAMTGLAQWYLPPQTSAAVAFLPLPGTNQIMIVSQADGALKAVRPWLDRIDAYAGPERRIFVVPVEPGKSGEIEKFNRGADPMDPDPARRPAARGPRVKTDSITGVLIVYATAREVQEIRNALAPTQQMEIFKQRLSAITQRFAATTKTP